MILASFGPAARQAHTLADRSCYNQISPGGALVSYLNGTRKCLIGNCFGTHDGPSLSRAPIAWLHQHRCRPAASAQSRSLQRSSRCLKPVVGSAYQACPAYVPLFVIVGVALDWAFFERMRTIIGMFRPDTDGMGYRDELWPRIALTILACLIVSIGCLPDVPNTSLITVGAVMFFASSIYVDCKMWHYQRKE